MDSVKAFVRTCCFLFIVSGVFLWAFIVSHSNKIPQYVVDHKNEFIMGLIHENWYDPIPLIGVTLMCIGIFWVFGESMLRPVLSFFGIWVVKPLQDWIGHDSELYRYHIHRKTADFSRWYERIKRYFIPTLVLYFFSIWLGLHIFISPTPFKKIGGWKEELGTVLGIGFMILMVIFCLRSIFNRHYSRNYFLRYRDYQVYAKFIGEYAPTRSRLEMRATLGRLGFSRFKPAIKQLEDFHVNERLEQVKFKKEFEGWKRQQVEVKKLEAGQKK